MFKPFVNTILTQECRIGLFSGQGLDSKTLPTCRDSFSPAHGEDHAHGI